MNINLFVIFLLGLLMKQNMNYLNKYEHKKIYNFFSINNLKFNPEQRS